MEISIYNKEIEQFFGGDPFRYFIFLRTYSRFLEKEGRRESWQEVVSRYMSFMKENLGKKLSETEYTEVKEAILHQNVMPSMRLLWSAGDAARKNHASTYNCSYVVIDNVKRFREIMFLLMSGCGVGFSVENKFVSKLPEVEKQTGNRLQGYIIQDSREGWSDALQHGVSAWFDGNDVDFDFSLLRPLGAKLKTFGGRSSGPAPLKAVLQFVRSLILNAQGRKLRSIEVHDICTKIAEVVVAGGSRRSSEISLSDLHDEEMRKAKSGDFYTQNGHRVMANNSTVYDHRPSQMEFVKEWLSLMESGSGERGIFNREGSLQFTPQRRKDTFSSYDNESVGGNPCQPSWAPILTESGIKKLCDVSIGDRIWSESGWTSVINKWSTGVKPVLKYKTNSGIFYGTENHRIVSGGTKVEVGEAESVDSLRGPDITPVIDPNIVMDGLMLGDGSIHMLSHDKVYLLIGSKDGDYFDSEVKDLIIGPHAAGYDRGAYKVITSVVPDELVKTYNRIVPDRYFYGSPDIVASFLRGLYSANGSICGKRVTLKAASKKLVEQVQIMLSSISIQSYITTNKPSTIKFSNGIYTCRESYDINISTDRAKFAASIGFIQKYKVDKLNTLISEHKTGISKTTFDLVDCEYISDEEVFDMTVDNDSHTYWTGGLNVSNCMEILLRSGQMCNLTSVVCRKDDNEKTLLQKIRIATILGTYQSTLTDFIYLTKVWQENCEQDRLLGVSLNGQYDCETVRDEKVMKKLKACAIDTNLEYAKRFKVNQSAAITCTKPEGTGSLMLGCSAGAHPRYDHYYIRRVRISVTDPLFKLLRDSGVPCHPENGQTAADANTWVLEFPVKSPEGSITRHDINAIDQLEHWKKLRLNYAEHTISMTVYVDKDEWIRVANWLWENWDVITGLSFLPKNDEDHVYELAPFSECTEEEYEAMASKFPKVNYDLLTQYENEDQTIGSTEQACMAGSCDLI